MGATGTGADVPPDAGTPETRTGPEEAGDKIVAGVEELSELAAGAGADAPEAFAGSLSFVPGLMPFAVVSLRPVEAYISFNDTWNLLAILPSVSPLNSGTAQCFARSWPRR